MPCLRSRLLAIVGATLLLGLIACSKVTPENYAKLEAGMTRDEVYAQIGKPDEVSGSGIGNLTMSSELWNGREHRIAITFAGDKLALKSIQAAQAQ